MKVKGEGERSLWGEIELQGQQLSKKLILMYSVFGSFEDIVA